MTRWAAALTVAALLLLALTGCGRARAAFAGASWSDASIRRTPKFSVLQPASRVGTVSAPRTA